MLTLTHRELSDNENLRDSLHMVASEPLEFILLW